MCFDDSRHSLTFLSYSVLETGVPQLFKPLSIIYFNYLYIRWFVFVFYYGIIQGIEICDGICHGLNKD